MTRRPHQEDGAGTVLSLALMGVLVTTTVATAGVVAVVGAHRSAQAAADLGALAGATSLQQGGDPCRAAQQVAERNGATLARCEVRAWDVVVETTVSSLRLPGGPLELRARGRAGPGQ